MRRERGHRFRAKGRGASQGRARPSSLGGPMRRGGTRFLPRRHSAPWRRTTPIWAADTLSCSRRKARGPEWHQPCRIGTDGRCAVCCMRAWDAEHSSVLMRLDSFIHACRVGGVRCREPKQILRRHRLPDDQTARSPPASPAARLARFPPRRRSHRATGE